MKTSTLFRFLVGDRDAILTIAASRSSFLISTLFVISAGFAREYDGEDLIHEPWHILRPLGASLLSGTTLFLLVHGAAMLRHRRATGSRPSFLIAYRTFLTLFWMTAPMAWLYAVPYERFMTPVDAVGVNLCTLGFVAAWRVVLITRVVQVIYGIHPAAAFFLVMLFADAVVFAAMTLIPTPIIDIMGGLRHSARDQLISGITFNLLILATLSAPLWILTALGAAATLKPRWPDLSSYASPPQSRGPMMVAAASLAFFIPLLPFTQPEQINRRDAERHLRAGRIAEAFTLMSDRSPSAYPPHWNPPPRLGYGESRPELDQVRDAIHAHRPADWVTEIYVAKIRRNFQTQLWLMDFDETQVKDRLEREWLDVTPDHAPTAEFLLAHDTTLTDKEREGLHHLIQAANPQPPTPTPNPPRD